MKTIDEGHITALYRTKNRELKVELATIRSYIELALCSTDLNNVRTILRAALKETK